MDANQLLHYLRGFFELVETPTPDQIRSIRNEILRAQPANTELIPVEVANPIHHEDRRRPQSGDCGCSGYPERPPRPYLDSTKLP